MKTKSQDSSPKLVAHHMTSSLAPLNRNIFSSLEMNPFLPKIPVTKHYHIVGPSSLRESILPNPQQQKQQLHYPQKRDDFPSKNFETMNSRKNMLSKITRPEQHRMTKQIRQMHRYHEYKDIWEKQSSVINKRICNKKARTTLIDKNVNKLYIQENEKKKDVLNNNLANFWQKSLRNNDPILKRPYKGNPFTWLQEEELLLTEQGTKVMERSIPLLPIAKLKTTNYRQLSLTGRNKNLLQTGGQYSHPSSGIHQNEEQVYKINYTHR